MIMRWVLRTVGLWAAKRGWSWWQNRRAQEGMDPTGDGSGQPGEQAGENPGEGSRGRSGR